MEIKKFKLSLKRRLQLRECARRYRKADPEKYRKRAKEWKKNHPEKIVQWSRRYNESPAGIWSNLKKRHNDTERRISKKDFIEWYQSQKRECVYCGLKESDLERDRFQSKRTQSRLQIDRKDNSKHYVKGNLVLACRLCNVIKGNIFNFDEMKIIGEMIKQKRKSVGNLQF